jgi:tRNA(Ile)-lysidine synthase
MVLASRWRDRPQLLVVTVDHGLRRESCEEARMAAQNADRLGLPWRIVAAPLRSEGGNLQDWARRARYQCLVDAAREAGFDTIMTAHHKDDQAETFMLRLARGSGVYGLAAMAEEGIVDGILLARPLLGTPRDTLTEIAEASGLPIVNDPSNANPRFDRVRMRELMPALSERGLTSSRVAETAARLRRAAAALDHYAMALLSDRFNADTFGVVEGDAGALLAAPEEVALRALALILRAVGGAAYTPELDSVEGLRSAILALGRNETLRRTLHGVVLTTEEGRLTARREWGRAGPPHVAATAGSTLVWDRRFRALVPLLDGVLEVGPLGRSEMVVKSPRADATTLRTLPGLYQNGALVAVPDCLGLAGAGQPLGSLTIECLVGGRLNPAAGGRAAAG